MKTKLTKPLEQFNHNSESLCATCGETWGEHCIDRCPGSDRTRRFVLGKKLTTEQRAIEKLKRHNRKLRAMCIVASDCLEKMTSEKFALGHDKPLREMLSKVIEETK